MNAQEIVNRLNAGERVIIESEDAGEFMMECARHDISCAAVAMHYQNGRCTMRIPRAERRAKREGMSRE